MLRLMLVAAVLGMTAGLLQAGKYNEQLSIGDPAPVWKDLPGVDDRKHSLGDLQDQDVVIVVFTCNSCPVALDYEDRIVAIAQKYSTPGSKVALVAINVNTVSEDQLPRMKERAKEKGFTFPYLYDESQNIAKQFGAKYTPEFFVLDKARRIAYMGAMDDKSKPAEVKLKYVEDAVDAILVGQKPVVGETLARGCMIRFNRPRREPKP